jgi:hypothetical protein
MTIAEALPIACALGPGEFEDRLTWIAALNREALFDHKRRNLVLKLRYAPGAYSRVQEMVRGEQKCCAFLDYDLRESRHEVRLTITAPEEAREAAEAVFEKFVAKARTPSASSSCACAISASVAKSSSKELPTSKAVGAPP